VPAASGPPQPPGCSASEISVAFLSPSLSREAGGIFEIERHLAQHLAALPATKVDVYGARDRFFTEDAALWPPVNVHVTPYIGPQQFRWSPRLRELFGNCPADVAHLHAIWMHTSVIIRRWSRRHRRPYLTSLNGMLEPWALRNARWKKSVCGVLYEHACLAKAACIHVCSENELASARGFGLKNPIAVIPNGVVLPPAVNRPTADARLSANGRSVLLYLGRIHPKKGLVNLLRAWACLRGRSFGPLNDWSLSIAGWDQGGHQAELQSLAVQLGIGDDVRFVGPQFGDGKVAALQSADAFVLPSFSEGLPMAVLEAWSYCKPVLMTPQCNLAEGFEAGAAVSAEPTTSGLAEGLAQVMSATREQRTGMGSLGRKLVEAKYAWPKVAQDMRMVYDWVIGGGSPPACIRLQ
jgi:glycosyltransferase involved in cell wall biosynthesis